MFETIFNTVLEWYMIVSIFVPIVEVCTLYGESHDDVMPRFVDSGGGLPNQEPRA
jgi:hypothetical protein